MTAFFTSKTMKEPDSVSIRFPVIYAALLFSLLVAGCTDPSSTRSRPVGDPSPRLYLVRHVEVWANRSATERPADLTAEDEERLTPHGQVQAGAAVGALQGTEARIRVVISSPVGRAEGTARAIADRFDPPVPLRLDDRWSWLATDETMDAGAARAAQAAGEALDSLRPGEAAVIVTHGDLIPALVGWIEGTPVGERIDRHTVPKGSITTLHRAPDGGWSLTVPMPSKP